MGRIYDDEDDRTPERRPRRPASAAPRRLESDLPRRRPRVYDDEYDDDDDYAYDEPRYARYSGAYARGGGGGCATSALYLVLGFLAIFLVLILVLPRLIGGAVSGAVDTVPEQLAQIVASPTPTVRDRGGTIQQIRNLNRLETQSFSVERVIDAGVEGNALQNLLFGDRILLIASGTVVAGVDLSKLDAGDVSISPDGTSITLRLPQSEIFQATLDNQRTRVYDRQQGLLAPGDKDLETTARQAAEAEILRAACEGGIMQRAADEAQQSMEQFLKLLEFESVTVIANAGPCVAAPVVPTIQPAAP